jgi:crotonobetaine/carnitine-CoA ligase
VLPLRERTAPKALARAVARVPDQAALIEPLGRTLTYCELDREAHGVAASLRHLGINPGETVVGMLNPNADNVVAWLAANIASIIWVPINTSYKGSLLQFVIEHSEARAIIIEAEWVDRLTQIADQLTSLSTVIVRGSLVDVKLPDGLQAISLESLRDSEPIEMPEPQFKDVSTIMYTSGTEGQSKGVLLPHGAAYAASISHPRTAKTEICLVALPFFHAGGLFTGPLQALRTCGTAVLHGTFSATRYFADARKYHCTTSLIVGPIAQFLLSQPPSPDDRDHDLTSVIMFPVSPRVDEFSERFGVPVAAGYGCTEVAAALLSNVGEARPGFCGEAVPHLEVQVVDEDDVPVAPGEVGEMVIRPREPFVTSLGYFKGPEATAGAWTNLWFHTGDLFRFDNETRQYQFVDRRKDVLRRRGENISSVEVERHLIALPYILEAAVIGVPSSAGEDEIRAIVVPVAGARIDPVEILELLYAKLPYFMVPRYYEVIDALPKTPTMKVKKAELRVRGESDNVWDCEAAGFKITRNGLVRSASLDSK